MAKPGRAISTAAALIYDFMKREKGLLQMFHNFTGIIMTISQPDYHFLQIAFAVCY